LVKWFSQEKGSEEADRLLEALEKKKIEIFLPGLVKYELGNALLKGKELTFSQAKTALRIFYELPLIFMEENLELAKLTYKLAEKFNLTYYDACFLALAKSQKLTLITANPKHQQKIQGVKILQKIIF
jgi:predicted nucleic acid-binding protein